MTRVFVLLLAGQLGLHTCAAEGRPAAWANVERLRSGQPIRVECTDGQTWTGRLVSVNPEALILNVNDVERQILRSRVVKADVKRRRRSVLIGLGAGAAAGVGYGYVAGTRSRLKSGEVPVAVGFGAALFGGIGAGLGALLPTWHTVYRSVERERPAAHSLRGRHRP